MFERLKKYLGVSVFVFIITLLIFGCMSLKTHVSTGQNQSYEMTSMSRVSKEFKIGSENFVFLLKQAEPIMDDMCKMIPVPCEPTISSTASGLVLSSDDASVFVITAAHFCVDSPESDILFKESIIGFAKDQPRELFVLMLDTENDLCMLMGPKIKNEDFSDVKIASNFTIGEEVYAVAAPLSMAGPNLRMIFRGNLAGCNYNACLSTIPATFGSSGGGIYNSRGELISIVMAVPEDFQHVAISPSNASLTKFIRDIDDIVDIYPY